MQDAVDARPSVFLSHASEDKPFVRRLARELRKAEVKVWLDEAELKPGDSLIDRIDHAIGRLDFLVVVISPDSVESDWVARELGMALQRESEQSLIKVLPVLCRGASRPPLLKHRLVLDFSTEDRFRAGFAALLDRVKPAALGAAEDRRFDTLLAIHPLLSAAWREIQTEGGAHTATESALKTIEIRSDDLAYALEGFARRTRGDALTHVARLAIALLDRHDAGYEAIELALDSDSVDDENRALIGMYMQYAATREATLWCHDLFVRKIRSDVYYNSMLARHGALLCRESRGSVLGYLLSPDRGPARYNIDSLELAIRFLDEPQALLQRWREWINGGRFDGRGDDGNVSPGLLYRVLELDEPETPEARKLEPIFEAVRVRLSMLLKSGETERVNLGLKHLEAMLDARWQGVPMVCGRVLRRVYMDQLPPSCWARFQVLRDGLSHLAHLLAEGADVVHDDELARYLDAARASD